MNKTAYISFEDVRAHADFQTVLSHYGIETTGKGNQRKILCPFHDDKNASCGVNLKDKTFHCFSCHAGGHVLDFVTMMEGGEKSNDQDRISGAHKLAEITGYSPGQPTKKTKSRKAKSKTAEEKSELPKVNTPLDLSQIRMELETDHPFFSSHNISDEMIKTFELGYTSIGIMKDRIVIPIHNSDGQVVAFAGRYAEEDVPDGTARYRLPKNFHRSLELFNLHRAQTLGKKYLVIVEGYWSAMRLHLEGIPVVATLGTSISQEQISLITSSGYRYVIVLFDGDEQGRTGATSVIEELSHHVYTKRLNLPDNIKPDTMPDTWLARLKP